MTNEERDIIAQFIARVGGAAAQTGAWGSGASVPATQPQLPPVDPEADRFIAEQFQAYPAARYRITQLAFVQEHALIEAQNRLRRLEWELQQTQQAAQQQQQGGARQGGGFFSNLFGGGRSPGPRPPGAGPWGQAQGQGGSPYGAPPPSQYPPGYQQGVFQRAGGSGFLGSALTTAAGVAGGVLAADAIRDMFSPRQGLGGEMGGGGFLGGAPADQGYVDQGTWTDPNAGAAPDQGYVDQGTWDQGGTDQSGWTDPGPAPDDTSGGGWDQGGGGWDQGSGGGSDDSLI
jgi:uncharacterized protein